jgi:glycerol uptake facilitator-like aquaporin
MKNRQLIQLVLKGIATLCAFISFVLYAAPFASTSVASMSGFRIAFDFSKEHVKTFFWSLLGLIFVVILIIYFVVSFVQYIIVLTGNHKAVLEDVKNKRKLSSRKSVIISSFAPVVLGVVVMILDFCTLETTGFNTNAYVHLGAGAIWSAILIFFGTIFDAVATCLPYMLPEKKDGLDYMVIEGSHITNASNEKTIEEKLVEINGLKEKGLISEEEYQAMRKKILGL